MGGRLEGKAALASGGARGMGGAATRPVAAEGSGFANGARPFVDSGFAAS